MAVLTVARSTLAGVVSTGVAAAAGGDEWANTGAELLQVRNGSGSPITATVLIRRTYDGLAAETGIAVTIAAGVEKTIGPFPPRDFNDGNGLAKVTYSLETSVTVAVIR